MPQKFLLKKNSLFTVLALCLISGCQMIFPRKTPCPKKVTCRPYCIDGKKYVPQKHYELDQKGYASYYGGKDGMHGCITCTGERFNMFAMTAAHKTLPIPSIIEVINLENGRKVILRVNDRGPFARNRILDVSAAAARCLGFHHKGYAKVRIRTLVHQSKKTEKKIKSVRRLAPQKKRSSIPCWYYVSLKAPSSTQAHFLSKNLKDCGHVHVVHTLSGAHVMMGPYRSCDSAAEMMHHVPTLQKGTIVKRCKTYPATHSAK